MSKKSTKSVATVAVTENLSERIAKEAELKALQRMAKAMAKVEAWEAKTVARNPAYVVGSLRQATEADVALLGHCHGKVCLIKCTQCGAERVVNKQDAFQTKFCVSCRDAAEKEAAKVKRAEKRVAGLTVEDIQKQIDQLKALKAAKAA
jgi:hypothetical protein